MFAILDYRRLIFSASSEHVTIFSSRQSVTKCIACVASVSVGLSACLKHFSPQRLERARPANSHGFTVRLTVWAINSRSHDLASKSHGESENLEIAKQFR